MHTRKQSLKPSVLTVAMLVLLIVAALSSSNWHIDADPDQAAIRAERSRRLALVRGGGVLPGTPDVENLMGRLASHGVELGAPVFIRIFKREFEVELWMKRDDRFHRFAVYPICRWSGELGPKLIEGDGQSPEGFYTISQRSLNPNSRWHRAFNLGFPNAHDRAHGRTGSFLMVHGGCSSVGCYAMTNGVIDELWKLVGAALRKGQPLVQVHVFPFRPTPERLAERAGSPWLSFWSDLRPAYEAFEATKIPPHISVCEGRYRVTKLERDRPTAIALSGDCNDRPGAKRAASGAL